ncbi:hypothetical protein FRC96_08135 [Lujinxingia vulgaris]|uniref:Uncharacterized protein n=1 Tax=Lujinxingia vulgaris TaxID=2600176 RepID=A0A5C6XJX1_9DELT|nr:hypothetical protein [Lujinxingia vulgaris]TXD37919.1 hypothetical protein FRC96_08135 [Lujinxingia vulgaris]
MNAPTSLKEAIDANDATRVAAEVNALGGDIDAYKIASIPVVLRAAAQSSDEALRALLDAGSNPAHFPDALHRVIFQGCMMSGWEEARDMTCLKLLIDAGCDPNGLDERGDSALASCLMAAVHPERAGAAARLLIAEGADPLRPENEGLLHRAVKTPASGVVEALLEGGVNANAEDGGVVPALSCAIELAQAFSRSRENPEDNSAEVAAEFCEDNFRLLIKHGADMSIRTSEGNHPLQIVFTIQDCPESIKMMLLDAGAPGHDTIGAAGEDVDFLAISMAEGHSGEMACRLYDAGCPLDVPYELFGGGSYVRLAAQYAPQQVLALCQHSDAARQTFLEYRSEKGFSPLANAIAGKYVELITYFLNAGLSADEKNAEGVSIRAYLAEGEEAEARMAALAAGEAALTA